MQLNYFVKKFVAPNTTVEIYREEIVTENDRGIIAYYHRYHKLETVMVWQITEPDDGDYYKAHPDVKPSQYRYYDVKKIIGVPNHIDRMDLVGIVVEERNPLGAKVNYVFFDDVEEPKQEVKDNV